MLSMISLCLASLRLLATVKKLAVTVKHNGCCRGNRTRQQVRQALELPRIAIKFWTCLNFVTTLGDSNACRICWRICCVSLATPYRFTATARFLTVTALSQI